MESPDHSSTHALHALMAARRHVAPRHLVEPGPDEAALRQIFEAAALGPDHGRLRPWRLVLVPAASRAGLGAAFAEALREREPDCSEQARQSAYDKAFHAPCLVAAVLRDGADAGPGAAAIPRDEKLVALGCAIQNMLLAAQALGVASGLASGASIGSAALRRFLRLEAHEQALCFLAFGTAARPAAARARPQPEDYVSSL